MFHVGVLLYGDHPELAERCLGSLVRSAGWQHIADIRIGLNEVSARTEAVLAQLLAKMRCPVLLYREETGRNVYKYPLMRRMLYDPAHPLSGTHWMWFDDDSYLRTSDSSWWRLVAEVARAAVLVGPVYKYLPGFRPQQLDALVRQPWYRGRLVLRGYQPSFCQGGWWVMSLPCLQKFDYPFRALRHNGGDVILGELCRQQEWPIKHFRVGVAANADAAGRESAAKRRGATTPGPWDGPDDLSHHDFTCVTTEVPCSHVRT